MDLGKLHEIRGPIKQEEVTAFSLDATAKLFALNDNGTNGGNGTALSSNPLPLVYDPRLILFGFTPENINLLLLPMLTNQ